MRYVWSRFLSCLQILSCLGLFLFQSTYAAEEQRITAGEVVSVRGIAFIRPDGRESKSALKPAKPGDMLYSNDVINTSNNGSVKILLKDKSIIDVGPSALFKMDKYQHNAGADREIEMNMLYGTLRGAVTQKIIGKGKFHLRTPTSTMGVRGTEFIVKTEVRSLEEVKHGISNPGTAMPAPKTAPVTATSAQPAAPGGVTPPPRVETAAKTEITVLQGKVEVAQNSADLEAPKKVRAPGSATPEIPKTVELTAGKQITTEQGASISSQKTIEVPKDRLTKMVEAIKIQDNTFVKNVVVEQMSNGSSGSNGEPGKEFSSEGGGGLPGGALPENIVAAVSSAIEVPNIPPVDIGDIGIPGSFGASTLPVAPQQKQPEGMKRIRVIITQ